MKRFITGDRKLRYEYLELFDAGNINDDGSILDPESARAHSNRVRSTNPRTISSANHAHLTWHN